jgi:hypothetical protein
MPVGSHAHVGLAKEVTFGTPVAAAKYVPFISESVVSNVEQVMSGANRGIYEESDSYNGGKTYQGDIVFDAHPNVLGDFLRSLLGAPVTTQPDAVNSPTVYLHTFTPTQTSFSTDCDLPPYTFEVHRDAASAWQYTGSVVNSLSLQIGTGQKIARATTNIIAKSATTIVKTTPSFETTVPFLFDGLAVTLGGSAYANIEDLTLTITNNVEGVMTLNQSREVTKMRRNGYRTFNLQYTIDFDGTLSQYNDFINGTERSMDIVLTGGIIEDALPFKLTLTMPKVRYAAFPVNVGNPNRITVQVAAMAKYNQASGYALRAALQNSVAAY